MKRVEKCSVLVICFGALLSLTNSVSALKCYQCDSGDGWSDCLGNSRTLECNSVSQASILGRNIFLPADASQIELACLSIFANGTVNGVTGNVYIHDCLFNNKALCSAVQDIFPNGVNIIECDLCTSDLCNGAGSIRVSLSIVMILAATVLLW